MRFKFHLLSFQIIFLHHVDGAKMQKFCLSSDNQFVGSF
jgi:hypothetical protein